MTQSDNKDSRQPKPVSLSGQVDYKECSIVSRTVVDKASGSLTLFSFDKGQALSEHTAPYDAMVYVFDGEAGVTISGKTMTVKQGEMVVMPANEPHALKANQRFKMMLVMIKS